MLLSEIIIEKIRKDGPISFHEFMETALYYPGIGYYTSSSQKIGKDGDYYTSPYATSVFGAMLAKQLEEMWRASGNDAFTIIEYGAGEGTLCFDILCGIKKNPAFYASVTYCIIEKSPAMQARQKTILHGEQIQWLTDINELKPFSGCVLANELIDNFAVHSVQMQEELMEIFVDYDNGFREILRPASDVLKASLQELNIHLPSGFRTEINIEANAWINNIAAIMQKGFVIIIDYGYSTSELFADKRRNGTLLCYHKHTINDNFYINIGEQDITAHVNFSALKNAAIKNGLKSAGYTNQAFFLRGLGITTYLKQMEELNKASAFISNEELMASYKFMVNMGQKLKVLILYRGNEKPHLSGMMFPMQLE